MSRKHRERRPHFELVPMIDVMMILTIFLAVMAFLPQVRTSLQAQLPQASNASETPPSHTVELSNAGLKYDQAFIASDRLEGLMKADIKSAPETSFVIAADKRLNYDQVIQLLDRMKGYGAKHIALATTETPK
jgi:biopolymer transport protein ExbD